jgi:hypothetical protein
MAAMQDVKEKARGDSSGDRQECPSYALNQPFPTVPNGSNGERQWPRCKTTRNK